MRKVSVDDALRLFDADRNTPWEEIRSLYRKQVRSAHPDLRDDEDKDDLIVSLNAAYTTLVEATENGKRPLPAQKSNAKVEPEANSVVRFSGTGDTFDRIFDISHDVGDVIYVSEDDGLIQVLIDAGKRSESVLLIQIDGSKQPVQVLLHWSCSQATSP